MCGGGVCVVNVGWECQISPLGKGKLNLQGRWEVRCEGLEREKKKIRRKKKR